MDHCSPRSVASTAIHSARESQKMGGAGLCGSTSMAAPGTLTRNRRFPLAPKSSLLPMDHAPCKSTKPLRFSIAKACDSLSSGSEFLPSHLVKSQSR